MNPIVNCERMEIVFIEPFSSAYSNPSKIMCDRKSWKLSRATSLKVATDSSHLDTNNLQLKISMIFLWTNSHIIKKRYLRKGRKWKHRMGRGIRPSKECQTMSIQIISYFGLGCLLLSICNKTRSILANLCKEKHLNNFSKPMWKPSTPKRTMRSS